MRRIFADASFYVAFLFPRDQQHSRAEQLFAEFETTASLTMVTTDAVIFEVLAFFSRLGPELRTGASAFMARIRASAAVHVVRISDDLMESAMALYADRPDQRYSLTDCASMVVCRDLNITDVLTTDRDFQAEGFHTLLR